MAIEQLIKLSEIISNLLRLSDWREIDNNGLSPEIADKDKFKVDFVCSLIV